MREYRFDLDVLKGIAIIVVILYHLEILSTGYLGVDVFFAINGFFIVPGVANRISEKNFSFFYFIRFVNTILGKKDNLIKNASISVFVCVNANCTIFSRLCQILSFWVPSNSS